MRVLDVIEAIPTNVRGAERIEPVVGTLAYDEDAMWHFWMVEWCSMAMALGFEWAEGDARAELERAVAWMCAHPDADHALSPKDSVAKFGGWLPDDRKGL